MTDRGRHREIDLDFTSLLDITLIILFFFIIFGSVSSEARTAELMESASAARAEADEKMNDAEELERQAEEKRALAEKELEMLETADAEKSEYYAAMREFASGSNLKMIYSRTEDGSWKLDVMRGTRLAGEIAQGENAAERFTEILESEGYTGSSLIMCEFIYDRTELLIEADNSVKSMVEQAKRSYSRLLVSYTDISRR